jgi:aspartate/methionine/tyrosine aminotransferase
MLGTNIFTATFISDEFYSGYFYAENCTGSTISAACNVEDVNEDDVLIIDGLTKRFRLPGWRIAWILGPKGKHMPINRR